MKNHLLTCVPSESSRSTLCEENGGADPKLLDLVRLRVAQLHQETSSIKEHLADLRDHGETSERLDQLATWGDSTLFDESERAALALCEKLTLDSAGPLNHCLIQEMRHHFTKGAIVSLTVAIVAVNDWNYSR